MLRCSQKDARFCQCESKAEKKGDIYLKSRMASKDVQIVVLLRKLHTREGMMMGQSRIPKGQK